MSIPTINSLIVSEYSRAEGPHFYALPSFLFCIKCLSTFFFFQKQRKMFCQQNEKKKKNSIRICVLGIVDASIENSLKLKIFDANYTKSSSLNCLLYTYCQSNGIFDGLKIFFLCLCKFYHFSVWNVSYK